MVCYRLLWNVIRSICDPKIDFFTMEIHLGYQNWQDYISKGCVCVTYHNILYSSEICVRVKIGRVLSETWNLYISNMANVLGFYTELGWQNVLISEDKKLKSHTVVFLHFFKMQDNRRWNDCNCMISYMPRKVFQNSALGRYISILLCWKLYVALSL